MTATYIYVFEDGTYGVSEVAPLPQDIEAIDQGTLLVLKCDVEPDGSHSQYVKVKVTEIDPDGNEQPPNAAKQENNEFGEYHYLGDISF